MTEAQKPPWAAALAALSTHDWPRTLHRASTFIRELRGDPDLAEESEKFRGHAVRTKDALRAMGRKAVGCKLPALCDCAFCLEEKP
jgi:hypothetical protein